MRKVVFLALFLSCQCMWAGVRPESRMRRIAASRLAGSADAASKMDLLESTPSYYIYGKGKQGFVVVSTDDSTTPVLGYSSTEYNAEDLPPAFKCWLKAVAASAPCETTSISYTVVPNFLPTTWGQGDPFNYLCPEIEGKKAPSGCVATAMSQIMYYYQYPAQGTGSGYYSLDKTGSSRYPDVINGVYRWELMKPDYSGQSVGDEERMAVATLLRDAGLGSHMNYATGGSGAYIDDAALALVNNFGYDSNTMRYMIKSFYSNEEWNRIVYEELAARRPILVAGHDAASGGHAFVFSGVDEDGKIYVNWGWNGSADGYYEMTALDPRGILGSDNAMKFNLNNQMVYGIQPPQGEPDESLRPSGWACPDPFTAEYQNIRNWLKVKTSFIYNISYFPFTGEIKLYCESADGDVTKDRSYTYLDYSQTSIASKYGYSDQVATVKTTDLEPGRYFIYLVSQTAKEPVPQKVRYPGGLFQYVMTKAENGKLTIEEDDSADNILSPLQPAASAPAPVYDLSGRMVNSQLKNGLYIVNGKKVLFK